MIHLIITAANIKENYELRKKLYVQSIEIALKYDYLYDSYTILECASPNEEYLNRYNVQYSNVQNIYPEKGLNEMLHLKSFIEQPDFKNDDVFIKMTGRYLLEDNSFFNKVKLLIEDYDSIFKDDSDIYVGRGYHTFLYCMKKYRFLDTIKSLNFSKSNMDPIEWAVKNYLQNKEKNYEIARLGIIAYQGAGGEKVFRS